VILINCQQKMLSRHFKIQCLLLNPNFEVLTPSCLSIVHCEVPCMFRKCVLEKKSQSFKYCKQSILFMIVLQAFLNWHIYENKGIWHSFTIQYVQLTVDNLHDIKHLAKVQPNKMFCLYFV